MKIKPEVLTQIGRHALRSRPEECCGILFSDPDDPGLVSLALPADNEAPAWRERRYALGHKAHLEAVAMEARGEARIAGYYHSHVWGPAWPSASDLEEAVPGPVYLIAALSRKSIQFVAWRVEGDEVVIEPVDLAGDQAAGSRRAAHVH